MVCVVQVAIEGVRRRARAPAICEERVCAEGVTAGGRLAAC